MAAIILAPMAIPKIRPEDQELGQILQVPLGSREEIWTRFSPDRELPLPVQVSSSLGTLLELALSFFGCDLLDHS